MKCQKFYIDVDIYKRLDIQRIKIYLNGIEQKGVIAAKQGINGFVEVYGNFDSKRSRRHIANTGELPTSKKRGNVRIKIKKSDI